MKWGFLLLLLSLLSWEVKSEPVCAPRPADIVFINDASYSVGSENFQKTLRFIESIVRGLVIGPYDTQIGLLTFENDVKLQFHLNELKTRQATLDRVGKTPYTMGWTHTDLALDFARQHCFTSKHGIRAFAAQVAIVITDGQSTNEAQTVTAAENLRDAGITVFAIGVGDGPNQDELRAIASDPDNQHVFSVEDFNALNKIKESLQQRTCEAKPAYICPGEADIVFLLENSDKVGQANLNVVLEMVRNVTRGFVIGAHAVQIGVDTFSTTSSSEFSLGDNNSQFSLKHALSSIKSKSGPANTGEALRKMMEESFSSSAGQRPNVPKLAVVIKTTASPKDELRLFKNLAQKAEEDNIALMAVGVGREISDRELKVMSSGDGKFIKAQQFASVGSLSDEIFPWLCGKITPKATQDKPCGSKADIVFVLDSTRKDKFEILKEFVKTFVKSLDIGQDSVRVAVVTFSSRPYTEFHLNRYNTAEELKTAIGRLEPKGSGRDLAAAITHMDNTMFKTANGDRLGIPNLGIILTEGQSSDPSKTRTAAATAKAHNITLFTLGVGQDVPRVQLSEMASEPASQHVLTVDDFTRLNSLTLALKDQACHAMPVNLSPETISEFASKVPSCEDKDPECSKLSRNVCRGPSKEWSKKNCERFCNFCGALSKLLSSNNKCLYKGKEYNQGDKWRDGCSYDCECEDASMGAYRCFNVCPTYYNLPEQCTLRTVPGQCCRQAECDFKKTYTTKDVHEYCVYNGKSYSEGQMWEVDCDFKCVCVNATTGFYSCQSRCPVFKKMPDQCKLVRYPGECCETPYCEFDTTVNSFTGNSGSSAQPSDSSGASPECVDKISDCDKYSQDLCSPDTNSSFALIDCKKSCGLCSDSGGGCIYNGETYQQNGTWFVGCEKECVCDDARLQKYHCDDLCTNIDGASKGCNLVEVPGPDKCSCKQLNCSSDVTVTPSELEDAGDEASDTDTVSEEVQFSVCGVAEEGQAATLTCSTSLEECENLFKVEWKADTDYLFSCTDTKCSMGNSVNNSVFSASVTNTNSTLFIKNVSRESPFDMETSWSCPVCGQKSGLVCDKLQVYAKPERPNCSVTENIEDGEIPSVTVSCSTDKVYPKARCSFYTRKGSSKIRRLPETSNYSHTETGPSPIYYGSQCSLHLSLEELGEGEHSFQVFMYPDVTGGERLVRGIVPHTTVNLSFPEVSHSCSPAQVNGYFSVTSVNCTCNMTSAGRPTGQAQWFRDNQIEPGDGVLQLTYNTTGQAPLYTCEAKSSLGRKVGSNFTARFPAHQMEDKEVKARATVLVTSSVVVAFLLIASLVAMSKRKST